MVEITEVVDTRGGMLNLRVFQILRIPPDVFRGLSERTISRTCVFYLSTNTSNVCGASIYTPTYGIGIDGRIIKYSSHVREDRWRRILNEMYQSYCDDKQTDPVIMTYSMRQMNEVLSKFRFWWQVQVSYLLSSDAFTELVHPEDRDGVVFLRESVLNYDYEEGEGFVFRESPFPEIRKDSMISTDPYRLGIRSYEDLHEYLFRDVVDYTRKNKCCDEPPGL